MGGPSSEREISLKTARSVYDSLIALGLDVVAIDITSDDPQETARLLSSHRINCAFIALHGYFGEDGQIQSILERMGIPYTGSGSQASCQAMDKRLARGLFAAAGLSVPQAILLSKQDRRDDEYVRSQIPFAFPWVIKPVHQGSSIGLSIIDTMDQAGQALQVAFSFDRQALIEQFIAGRELTVGILDDQALPVIEIVTRNKFFDYQAKYQTGFTDYIVPAELDAGTTRLVQAAAVAAHKAVGCHGYSRVDLILDAGGTAFILEVNTIPGMTQTSLLPKAARVKGIDFSALSLRLLELAYEKK